MPELNPLEEKRRLDAVVARAVCYLKEGDLIKAQGKIAAMREEEMEKAKEGLESDGATPHQTVVIPSNISLLSEAIIRVWKETRADDAELLAEVKPFRGQFVHVDHSWLKVIGSPAKVDDAGYNWIVDPAPWGMIGPDMQPLPVLVIPPRSPMMGAYGGRKVAVD